MSSLDEFVDIFDLLGDWDQRYQYLIELGEKLPEMPEELKTDDNKVRGCMSQVWVSAYSADEGDGIHYHGFCDTSVIRGVLALLIQLVDGRPASEVHRLDVDEIFEQLNLHEHLSPNRHLGVYAIVDLMQKQARALEDDARRLA